MAVRHPHTNAAGLRADAERVGAWLAEDNIGAIPEETEGIMRLPTNHVRFQDTPPSVCFVAVSPIATDVRVIWLFPRMTGMLIALQPLLRECLIAVGDAQPESLDWEVWAKFPLARGGSGIARAWQAAFPSSQVVTQTPDIRISLPTLREAIAVVRMWPRG